MSSFYAGAYWGGRGEDRIECAGRLLTCLTALAVVDPSLSGWYRKGSTKRSASKNPVETSSRDVLADLLATGQNRREVGGEVISELGFSASLWNRADDPSAFRVTCGASISDPSLKNVFVLQLPGSVSNGDGRDVRPLAVAVIRALVESWEPDWATFSSTEWRAAQKVNASDPVAGLVTYIALRPAASVPVAGFTREPFHDGALFISDFEPDRVTAEQMVSLQESLTAR